MRSKILTVLIIVLCLFSTGFISKANADELDDINKQISELTDALNKSIAATEPLEDELDRLTKELNGIRSQINTLELDINKKKKDIDKSYETMEEKQQMFATSVRDSYIKSYYNSPILAFLSTESASTITKVLAYQKALADRDKSNIANLALSIVDLETKKKNLEIQQSKLIATKSTLDEQSGKLDTLVKGAKDYQAQVSGQLADLSAKQQEILNARSGNFVFSIGDGELADEYLSSIKGFNESAPAGSFGIFSFGAYTHRKGMSQYGARGRAGNGQGYRDILQAYFQKQPVNKDTGGTIKVSGVGDIDFESQYLYGIAEMPSTWPMEALKAQAVAARTYAYRYKSEGREICTKEACQVYNSGKAANPPDAWRQAVDGTRGEVLEDVVTYYSSTTGGYVSPLGWDTTDGSGGSNFIDKTYEKLGGSPWLYKAWWRQGYSVSGATCGRSNPYLNGTEMADIINAAMILLKGGSGDETQRVTPVTTSCWSGNPYSMDELRSVSEKYGGGVTYASGVTVTQGNGSTSEVIFQTDKGQKSFSGSDFKTAFNLRAPGYLSIPQSGFAFFNIEKK